MFQQKTTATAPPRRTMPVWQVAPPGYEPPPSGGPQWGWAVVVIVVVIVVVVGLVANSLGLLAIGFQRPQQVVVVVPDTGPGDQAAEQPAPPRVETLPTVVVSEPAPAPGRNEVQPAPEPAPGRGDVQPAPEQAPGRGGITQVAPPPARMATIVFVQMPPARQAQVRASGQHLPPAAQVQEVVDRLQDAIGRTIKTGDAAGLETAIQRVRDLAPAWPPFLADFYLSAGEEAVSWPLQVELAERLAQAATVLDPTAVARANALVDAARQAEAARQTEAARTHAIVIAPPAERADTPPPMPVAAADGQIYLAVFPYEFCMFVKAEFARIFLGRESTNITYDVTFVGDWQSSWAIRPGSWLDRQLEKSGWFKVLKWARVRDLNSGREVIFPAFVGSLKVGDQFDGPTLGQIVAESTESALAAAKKKYGRR